jgi:lipopolysaccharide/colanic/teichoic acid biosynthesis glycosyltransferase
MKRVFDFIFATIGLLVLSPLFLIIIGLIRYDSEGGAMYLQKRVGLNNNEFVLFKFRTMQIDSERKGFITIGNNDVRITKIGRFLRKYKIDELPQLINVFLGDMSLVGPRPEVRKYVDLYTEEQKHVLSIKPGISDYASIKFLNENELLANSLDPNNCYENEIMPEKLRLNLIYIKNRSLFEDVKIVLLTFKSIILN